MTAKEANAVRQKIVDNPLSDFTRMLSDPKHPEKAALRQWQQQLYDKAYSDSGDAQQFLAENPGASVEEAQAAVEGAAIPETPEAYAAFEIPVGMRHMLQDQEFESEAKTMFHSAGASQQEANSIVSHFFLAHSHAPCDAETCQRALGALWKSPTDYAANLARAQRVYREAKISDRLRAQIDQSGLRNNASVIATLAAIGKRKGY
jgi:hypothetical protein